MQSHLLLIAGALCAWLALPASAEAPVASRSDYPTADRPAALAAAQPAVQASGGYVSGKRSRVTAGPGGQQTTVERAPGDYRIGPGPEAGADSVAGALEPGDYITGERTAFRPNADPATTVVLEGEGKERTFRLIPGLRVDKRIAPEAGASNDHTDPGAGLNAMAPQIIFSDGFDGAWSWDTYGYPTWRDTSYRWYSGGASAWCAETGLNAPGPYAPNMTSFMIYGPFNLSDAEDAIVTFYYWLDSELDYDRVWFCASGDNQDYYGWYDEGRYRMWQFGGLNLSDWLGDSSVWFAVIFESDFSIEYEGAYVDDVVIEKEVGPGGDPDLVVDSSSLAPQTGLHGGDPVDLADLVCNVGTGPTGGDFWVGWYISADPNVTTSDYEWAFRPSSSLNPGECSGGSGTLAWPDTAPFNECNGTFYVAVIADDLNQIPESNESNNRGQVFTVSTWPCTAEAPDLIVESSSLAPQTGVRGGDLVDLADTVCNAGADPTGGDFGVGWYISEDPHVSTLDYEWAFRPSAALNPGECSSSAEALSWPDIAPFNECDRTFYVAAIADHLNQITEPNENNNRGQVFTVNTWPCTIGPPDLMVDNSSVEPQTKELHGGDLVDLADTTCNVGTGPTGRGFRVGWYVSENPVVTTSDFVWGFRISAPLNPGECSSGAGWLPWPDVAPFNECDKRFYVAAIADHASQVAESNENNNLGQVFVVNTWACPVEPPDLTVDGSSLAPQTGELHGGDLVDLADTTCNVGTGSTARPFWVAWYISHDPVVTTSDPVWCFRLSNPQDPGQCSSGAEALPWPDTAPFNEPNRRFYVAVMADDWDEVSESDEINNWGEVFAVSTWASPVPDLMVEPWCPPPEVGPGDPVDLTDTVCNVGTAPTGGGFQVGWYLSEDPEVTTSDFEWGRYASPALGPGQCSGGVTALSWPDTAPFNVPGATFYVAAMADVGNTLVENSEDNNWGLACPVTVCGLELPDLIIESSSLVPSAVSPGDPAEVADTVCNLGTRPTGTDFWVAWYISEDPEMSASDFEWGFRLSYPLVPAQCGDGSAALLWPDVAPFNEPGRTFYVAVTADDLDQIGESNEENNWGEVLAVTVACDAMRICPPAYCSDPPPVPVPVKITLDPPPGAQVIGVEDYPPAGWESVMNISDGGEWDPVNNQVKWGPLFPPFPAELTYEVLPPEGRQGTECWVGGTVSFDGAAEPIGGDECMEYQCAVLHPADLPAPPCPPCTDCSCATCQDCRIEMCEMLGYACQWKQGSHDNLAEMTRAAYLWKVGEYYCWDPHEQTWFPAPPGPCQACPPDAAAADADELALTAELVRDSATRKIVADHGDEGTAAVLITIDVSKGARAVALDDCPPAGCVVSDISAGGQWDPVNRKVKWGPFLDSDVPTAVSYKVRPAQGRSLNVEPFFGSVSVDGAVGNVASPGLHAFEGSAGSEPAGDGLAPQDSQQDSFDGGAGSAEDQQLPPVSWPAGGCGAAGLLELAGIGLSLALVRPGRWRRRRG